MKVFISQVMNGRTDEEIRKEREAVIAALKETAPDSEVIDSFFCSAPHSSNPLWFLGKSFELLSGAKVCIFVDHAEEKGRGCRMEYEACKAYGIDSYNFDPETCKFESYEEHTIITRDTPVKAQYLGFSPHDSAAWYRCPACHDTVSDIFLFHNNNRCSCGQRLIAVR